MRSIPVWLALAMFAAGCGGTVGTGGGAGGDAGAGGGGGGGAGGAGGASIEELIDRYCAKLAALGCSGLQPEADCRVAGRQAHSEAIADGCVAQFDAALRCAANAALTCANLAETACGQQIDALEECSRSESCGRGGGAGPGGVSCSVDCSTYSAQCAAPTSVDEATCSCTSGPATGVVYTANNCESGIDDADAICR